MSSDSDVIKFLNEALTAELTAVNQYILQSKMCEDWGYLKLASLYRSESIDEMRHAEQLIERILLLEGLPDLQRLGRVGVGKTVEEQIQLNRELEQAAVDRYRRGIVLCLETGDAGTRDLLEKLLVGEEEHLDWLKTQQSLISDIGIKHYQHLMLGEMRTDSVSAFPASAGADGSGVSGLTGSACNPVAPPPAAPLAVDLVAWIMLGGAQ